MQYFYAKSYGSILYSNMGACDPSIGVEVSVDEITIDGFEIANWTSKAVFLKAKNCVINNCDFSSGDGWGEMGIYIDSESNDNIISNNYGDKIYIHQGSFNNSVVGNTVSTISVSWSELNTISNNKVDVIGLGGDSNIVKNNTILKINIQSNDNIIKGNNFIGENPKDCEIRINEYSKNNTITSNRGNFSVFVWGSYNAIENNKLMSVSLGSGTHFNTINGNEIFDSDKSVKLYEECSDNILKDNLLLGRIYDEREEKGRPLKNSLLNNTNVAGAKLADSTYSIENLTAPSFVLINRIIWSEKKLELYNAGNESVNIGGWMVWGSGGMGEMIAPDTIIFGKERFEIDFPYLLDEGKVKLENTYRVEKDQVSYENALKHIGEVYSRAPDGKNNWAWIPAEDGA